MSNKKNIKSDSMNDEFEKMMEQRIKDNFNVSKREDVHFTDERLKEMNKKLPEWSLEPPYSFLK